MDNMAFLGFEADLSSPAIVSAYDELPLWSAMFGLLMLEHVPLAGVARALDIGCGTGFPLIELAERLGPTAQVDGIDLWPQALARAAQKIAARGTPNVHLHEASASALPFAPATFDLIVSNLGINNFDNPASAIAECRRVSRLGATLALTTNLQGHMREFYDMFDQVLSDDESRQRLRQDISHRATVAGLRELLNSGGFEITRVVERETVLRFASGTALLNHHFIKLAFLDAWKKVVSTRQREVFAKLRDRLDAMGELRLTIPMAYVEGRAR